MIILIFINSVIFYTEDDGFANRVRTDKMLNQLLDGGGSTTGTAQDPIRKLN